MNKLQSTEKNKKSSFCEDCTEDPETCGKDPLECQKEKDAKVYFEMYDKSASKFIRM